MIFPTLPLTYCQTGSIDRRITLKNEGRSSAADELAASGRPQARVPATHRIVSPCLFLGVLLAIWLLSTDVWGQRNLRQIPDPDPAVTLDSFTLPAGMQANLFASEGQIAKPIHMNFDARGRLWVAGSEVYPHILPGQAASDKVMILEDTTGDGVADQATVFADNLLIPTGILPDERGGCYVVNSTELLYLWDSTGDGQADQRRVVLSGFGTEDTHHLLHTLTWGPDGSLFMSQSIYIHSHIETPWGVRRMNGGGIWRFRPDTLELEVHCLGFVNSWGTAFDLWGQSFATDGAYGEGINYVFPNSVFVTSPGATRIVGGMNPGSPKHCGLEIISGRHFPDDWQGNMITNDFRANRVCRFQVEPGQSSYRSRQLEEVIRSTHQAFRPIDAKMGPDGALYIADWYNPIIQHGEVDFRDPRRDRERGRIWRLSFSDRPLVARENLSRMNSAQLLEQLWLPEQSTRMWAKRMLRLRDPSEVRSAIAAQVERILPEVPPAEQTDAHAASQQYMLELLWAGLHIDYLHAPLLDLLLESHHAGARAAAVRVASDFLWRQQPEASVRILERAIEDEHPQVRLEAICGLRRHPNPRSATVALRALHRPLDDSLDFALWKTLRDLAGQWLPLAEAGRFDFGGDPVALTYALKAVESRDVVGPLMQLLRSGQVSEDSQTAVLQQVASQANPQSLSELLDWIQQNSPSPPVVWRRFLQVAAVSKVPPDRLPEMLSEQLQRLASDGLSAMADQGLGLESVESLLDLAVRWQVPEATELLWSMSETSPEVEPELVNAAARALIDGWVQSSHPVDQESWTRLMAVVDQAGLAPELRRRLLGQLARVDLVRAVPRLVSELATLEGEDIDLQPLLNPILGQRDGQAQLSSQLAASETTLPADVARQALRLVRASPAPEEALLTALRGAGRLSEAGWKFDPAQWEAFLQRVVNEGDAARGEHIYRRAELQCLNCHAIGGVGSVVGPDMISIGASAPVDYLLESLIDPDAKIKEGYHSKKILTLDGRIVTGMVQSFADKVYRLRLADGSIVEIMEDDIDQIADGNSLMPAGLVDGLTAEELADLTKFLAQLGRHPDYTIRSEDIVRAWESLPWSQAAHQLLNRTSFDRVATLDPVFNWQPILPLVSGAVPLAEVAEYKIHANVPPTRFLRTKIEILEAGSVELDLEVEEGVQIWVDGVPTPLAGSSIRLDLPQGMPELVFAIDGDSGPEQLRVRVQPAGSQPAVLRLPLRLTPSP